MAADTATDWDHLTDPAEIADALIGLYEARGANRYGESVTQAEHARQSGAFAMASGSTDADVVAAFFHDIGHLLDVTSGGHAVDRRHEETGAAFLARFFGDDVTVPVLLHVPAKRYLCATDPAYFTGLSPASIRSLHLQGGPMTPNERNAFEAVPGHEAAVTLRRWDDLAKVPGAPTPPLDTFRRVVLDLLRRP